MSVASYQKSRVTSSYEADDQSENPGVNIHVAGLDPLTREKDLQRHFGQYGRVVECKLILDPRTEESRQFAFISFATPQEAQSAISLGGGSILDGKAITVKLSRRAGPRSTTPGKYLGKRTYPAHAPEDLYARSPSSSPSSAPSFSHYSQHVGGSPIGSSYDRSLYSHIIPPGFEYLRTPPATHKPYAISPEIYDRYFRDNPRPLSPRSYEAAYYAYASGSNVTPFGISYPNHTHTQALIPHHSNSLTVQSQNSHLVQDSSNPNIHAHSMSQHKAESDLLQPIATYSYSHDSNYRYLS